MSVFAEGSWFAGFFSRMREDLNDARCEIEDSARRPQIDMFLLNSRLCADPEALTAKRLAAELGKAMARDRLGGLDLERYDGLFRLAPSLRGIHDALLAPEFYRCVQIPPTPAVIVDGRIARDLFWKEINEQVFDFGSED